MTNLRTQFPVFERYTYLNTASSGLMYKDLLAHRAQLDQKFMEGGSVFRNSVYEDLERVKTTLTEVFNCPQDRISLVPNASLGLNATLEAFAKGQRVLLLESDYPSLVWPFQSRDFECRMITQNGLSEESLMMAIRQHQPRILAVSLVQWENGMVITPFFLSTLKKHFPDLIIIADGTQFLGTTLFDFDKSGIDLLMASTYKWLCAGYGNGLLFFSPQLINLLQPKTTGYNTFRSAEKSTKPLVTRYFEPGHLDYMSFESLKFSVAYFSKVGFDVIQQRISGLMRSACSQLQAAGFSLNTTQHPIHASGIISVKAPERIIHFLEANNIICSYRNGLRVSMHAYNNEEDLSRLMSALRNYS
ncbi:MAG: aminotransferase class V-fold PLP-dependent enzyme [Saprospiraceae bacterium]|nr:aminotransferase class V-fold PLP-dependent enzyme [Saprospiraceae bacterium]